MIYLTTETIHVSSIFFIFSFLKAKSIAPCLSMRGLWKKVGKGEGVVDENHLSSLEFSLCTCMIND